MKFKNKEKLMKKAFPYLLTLAIFASCTKKNKSEQVVDDTIAQDTIENVTPTKNNVPKVEEIITLKEWSPEAVGNLVKAKKNDTLYVTNFFATWCGPCVRELPHFKSKMEEMKGQPVKFTYVSLDQTSDWEQTVPEFSKQQGIEKNVILLNGEHLDLAFFRTNFKTWDGGSIPFTIFSKNGKTDEYTGMMTEEVLNQKLTQF